MALRVLRLVTVASIFAFVLAVRTVAPIHAAGGPADDTTPVLVDPSSTVPGSEDPPIDPPPPPEPPTEQPPIEAEPPPIDPVEPPPIDPPPPDTTQVVEPPTEPPVEAEPPPAEAIEPTPTEPPADPPEAVLPPPDPPVDEEPPPGDIVEPAPADPPITDALPPPLEDPSVVGDDRIDAHPSTAKPALSVPTTHRSAVPVPRVAGNAAPAATTPVALIVNTLVGQTDASPERAHTVALHPAIAAGAGLAAGIALTSQAPSSVAVAIEFGRAGGGWAGALVFNLWLRRQMRERRMSQRRLADLAGVDHSTISRLLRQDRRPSLTTATKLARALKQVPGEGAEPEAADYFERIPEETVFPARRVELALRADEMLNDDQVRRLMNIYLDARRRNQASAPSHSPPARAAPHARR